MTIVAIVRRNRCLTVTGTPSPSTGTRRCHLAAAVSGPPLLRSSGDRCLRWLTLLFFWENTDSLLWPKIRKERGHGLLLRKRGCYTETRKLYLACSEMIALLAWSIPAALHKWVGPIYCVLSVVRCFFFIFCSKKMSPLHFLSLLVLFFFLLLFYFFPGFLLFLSLYIILRFFCFLRNFLCIFVFFYFIFLFALVISIFHWFFSFSVVFTGFLCYFISFLFYF